ncbi:amidase [Palleronia caenipelagi]|uniref:Amidase n=1 Tax=Palleronia caenipelagi TaxID=2489174 RepID=A0A547PMC0_9RHOB|nr:amidase [Palleronia caenipelagi]TRD15266.1 amidase [Palleronia caenipelagi]
MGTEALRAETGRPVRPVGVLELRDRLASGALSAEDLVGQYIARIEAREPEIRAWAWFDPDFVWEQARALDRHRRSGRPIGPLHGLPVGLKDVIDTARIPTENGTMLDAGRVPLRDAAITERLRAAGAILMGKTVTTELAFMHPGATRNPHNPAHTPGGSSQGSAAAVADGMVPLAVGTQTGGSVIRPASFCGVTGYKPTFGAISRRGVLTQSPSLDTVGVFAADTGGAALLAQVLMGYDADDPATGPDPVPDLVTPASAEPRLKPIFAFVKPPGWDDAHPDLHAAFGELTERLGDRVFEVELPAIFDEAAPRRQLINEAEMAYHYFPYAKRGGEQLADVTRASIGSGNAVPARDYLSALALRDVLSAGVEEILTRATAILCPAAPGPAPEGLGSTGDAIFNGLWTYCGAPCVTLPLLTAENGLPMGVQLVGARHQDARLISAARWLTDWADAEATTGGTS